MGGGGSIVHTDLGGIEGSIYFIAMEYRKFFFLGGGGSKYFKQSMLVTLTLPQVPADAGEIALLMLKMVIGVN